MTDRKPPGVTWETWIDRQIRVGIESGAFDGLPGAGRPVRDLGRPRDEMWWVREKVRREGLSTVPPAVQVRRELDAAEAAIAVASSESEVRALVARINERVRWVNSRPVTGPPSTVAPLDADVEVAAWRASRPEPSEPAEHVENDPVPSAADGAPSRRWLQRWRRRRG